MNNDTARVELGCGGHFIGHASCLFRRHTQVGNFRVSTVGDYRPRDGKPRATLGLDPDSFFETMVFRTGAAQAAGNEGCGCREVKDWSEIDRERYSTAGEAQRGHERMVAKYSRAAITKAEGKAAP